ncbi:MAG TPA: biotin-dependent carboxyltransferase family protein [Chitinophagaceae bacterium]|nr:biotin-dependent carboxyltransferase family protein [Chitinophagaceae bacterium]
MSIRVIKAGLLDTIQDMGRNGYQHLGINPGGVMDRFASTTANFLLGNDSNEAVIEMHFPGPAFLFEEDAIIAIDGADFSPTINGEKIRMRHPLVISKSSVLHFDKLVSGARAYISIRGGLALEPWLGSYSTNLKAAAGGFKGRHLQRDDVIRFRNKNDHTHLLHGKDFLHLPWEPDIRWNAILTEKIAVTPGHEWERLNESSRKNFYTQPYSVSNAADRMGYRLAGNPLGTDNKKELVSSAVSFGTIQLLPDGQLIVLMADHQTTGGYPRIGHVISAHLPRLAQLKPGDTIRFSAAGQREAEELYLLQRQHLLQLQNACIFRLADFFNDHL